MMESVEERSSAVREFLERIGVGFESVRHQPIYTVEEGREIAARSGSLCCKNLFLAGRRKDFYLVMIPHEKRLDLKALAGQAGSGRLSFGSADDLGRLLGTTRGAVGPLGLVFDTACVVNVLVDRDVLKSAFIHCHPCRNDESLKILVRDLVEVFIPATGHEARLVDVA